MKPLKVPFVSANQRALPGDFNGLAAACMGAATNLIGHLLIDPAADNDHGLVSWGLTVSAVGGATPMAVRVAVGAGILSGSTSNTDEGQALVELLSTDSTTVTLESGVANRTYIVYLVGVLETGDVSARDFRSVAAGGDVVQAMATPTTRRFKPRIEAYYNGTVPTNSIRLASVAVAANSVVIVNGNITSTRVFCVPWGASSKRGIRQWLISAKAILDGVVGDLAAYIATNNARVAGVITPGGKLQSVVPVDDLGSSLHFANGADGQTLDLGSRRLKVKGFRPVSVPDGDDLHADDDNNDGDGYRLNACNVMRACAVVHPTTTIDGIHVSVQARGQNVSAVAYEAPGFYTVQFEESVVPDGADIFDGTWGLVVTPTGFDGSFLDDMIGEGGTYADIARAAVACNVTRVDGRTIKVRTRVISAVETTEWFPTPFVVQLYGPWPGIGA